MASFITRRLTLHLSHHLQSRNINHQTGGRETNSAQSCDDGMAVITDATLPSIELLTEFCAFAFILLMGSAINTGY